MEAEQPGFPYLTSGSHQTYSDEVMFQSDSGQYIARSFSRNLNGKQKKKTNIFSQVDDYIKNSKLGISVFAEDLKIKQRALSSQLGDAQGLWSGDKGELGSDEQVDLRQNASEACWSRT